MRRPGGGCEPREDEQQYCIMITPETPNGSLSASISSDAPLRQDHSTALDRGEGGRSLSSYSFVVVLVQYGLLRLRRSQQATSRAQR